MKSGEALGEYLSRHQSPALNDRSIVLAIVERDPEVGERIIDLRASIQSDAEKLEYRRTVLKPIEGSDALNVVKEIL